MSGWQLIGEIPVDTARMVLVDPMNVEDVARHEDAVQSRLQDAGSTSVITNELGLAVGVMFSTGLGDGAYPVEARFEEAAGAVRIAEVRVRFLPHPTHEPDA